MSLPNSIPVTKEQTLEVLIRFQYLARSMYYGPLARPGLNKQVIDFDGQKFTLDVLPTGLIEMRIVGTDIKAQFAPFTRVRPPPAEDSICNLDYQVAIQEPIHPEYKDWFERASIFVLSSFQRTQAFVFLARMEEETLMRIAGSLAAMTPKDQPIDHQTDTQNDAQPAPDHV